MITTYACWRGGPDIDDRMDEAEIRAYSAGQAAEKLALRHDEGEDGDTIYVIDGDEIHEYHCRFVRDVTCDYRCAATWPLPASDEAES